VEGGEGSTGKRVGPSPSGHELRFPGLETE